MRARVSDTLAGLALLGRRRHACGHDHAAVIEGGGDYILPVKDNQPTLRADIEAAFAEPEAGLSPPPEQAPCRLPGSGHDRGQGAWSDREADAGVDDLAGGLLGRRLAGLPASVPPAARAAYGSRRSRWK